MTEHEVKQLCDWIRQTYPRVADPELGLGRAFSPKAIRFHRIFREIKSSENGIKRFVLYYFVLLRVLRGGKIG